MAGEKELGLGQIDKLCYGIIAGYMINTTDILLDIDDKYQRII